MKTGLRLLMAGLTSLVFHSSFAQTITSAGRNHHETSSTTLLTGSISGSGSSYSWSTVSTPASAPAPVIATPSSLSTSVSNLVVGTYKFRLTGTGAGNYQEVYVFVTGSRGAALINVDFGQGTTSQQVSEYLTSIGSSGSSSILYQHNGTSCPPDNWYSILPSTDISCFAYSWLGLRDHTGNSNGRFLIVNANYYDAGIYYEQTINNLCPGTAYEFSTWIADLNNIEQTQVCPGTYTPVDITFSLYNGNTLIFQKNTGTVHPKTMNESDAWMRYAGSVKVPQGVTSLRLVMTSIQGGCGTDFGMDDIQLTPLGPKVNINLPGGLPGPAIFEYPYGASWNMSATPQPVTLDDGTLFTFENPVYQWQHLVEGTWVNIAGQTSLTYQETNFQRADTGSYRLVMANQGNIANNNCNVFSNILRVYGPGEITLPISLSSFGVQKNGNNAILNWATASEKENLYFEVYRSTDGLRFDRVGTVAGNGTINSESAYSYNDPIDGLRGTVYYRLKDIDVDGRGTFSKIVSLNLDGRTANIDFNTYPNPFVKDLKLVVNSQREKQATVVLTDVTGQKVVTKSVLVQRGQNIIVLPDLDRLSKGVYMIQLMMEGETFTQKVIKN